MNAPARYEYRALGPIWHDGTFYAPGESLELTKGEAAPIIAVGQLEPVDDNHDGKADSAPSTRGRKAAAESDEERPLLDPDTTGLEVARAPKASGKASGKKPRA